MELNSVPQPALPKTFYMDKYLCEKNTLMKGEKMENIETGNSEKESGQDKVACLDCGGDDYDFDWQSSSLKDRNN